jgi:hypothetical protein
MYRPPKDGLGNILMHLCQVDTVSSELVNRGYTKYINIKKTILDDDGRPSAPWHTYIVPELHTKIRDIIEPTDLTKSLVNKYWQDVAYGLQIRRGGLSTSESISANSFVTCDDVALAKFYTIADTIPGKFLVVSDCLKIKRDFMQRYPDRVITIEEEAKHLVTEMDWLSWVEFFMLSKCPHVFMSGGTRDMNKFSTYGYMACIYGNCPCEPVFND